MTINIPIPADLERELRATTPNLEDKAKEAVLVDLYRQGKLLHKQLAESLRLDRWQTEDVLYRHGVSDLTPDEITRQFQTVRRLGI